jgi:ribosome-associated toxin RatA of RatAB toxin-antitoxin module
MKKISRAALLNYSAEQLYQVVLDVEQYPDFLPWCGGVEVIDKSDDTLTASITIAKMGLRKAFSTQNRLVPGQRIEMNLVEGPFSYLQGEWGFKPLGEQACKITFDIEFEVRSGLMSGLLNGVFEQVASTMVDSFVKRAKQLYGDSK